MLEVDNLVVNFANASGGKTEALKGVSFTLKPGETLGIVGESGSGKSVFALTAMGLLPQSAYTHGSLKLNGQDLLSLSEKSLCQIRGVNIGMVFQEPMSALNPAMTIGEQVAEAILLHQSVSPQSALDKAKHLLTQVKMPDIEQKIHAYPHQLSGGQRQRVCIAIALALEPDILIADEPTTALDVTVQAQVLSVIKQLVKEMGIALILISHDIGVIATMTERTLVMYRGEVMEQGKTLDILRAPQHSYTQRLLASLPRRTQRRLGIEVIL